MINFGDKRIIDVILYKDDLSSSNRIKKIVTSKDEVVYNNPLVAVEIESTDNSNTAKIIGLQQYLNVGDGETYYIWIQQKPYKISDITCDSPNVVIKDNYVQFNQAGNYLVTLKYKTYTFVRNIFITHIAVSLA